MSVLQSTLMSLVRDNRDPTVLIYALENLGKPIPANSKYSDTFIKSRQELQQIFVRLRWDPVGAWDSVGAWDPVGARNPAGARNPTASVASKVLQRQTASQQAVKLAKDKADKADKAEAKVQQAMVRVQQAMVRAQQAMVKAQQQQLQEMAKEQAKQTELINGLLRKLVKEDDAVVLNQLHDEEPMNRYVAVLIADYKRLPIQETLIDLLADRHVAVRQAAHQALVRLGRSTDFGPAPNANATQIGWRSACGVNGTCCR